MAISVSSGSGPTISTARTTTGRRRRPGRRHLHPGPADADTDYTVTAVVVHDTAGEALRVRRVRTLSATEVTVNVINDSLTSQTGVVHVLAVHD